MAAILFEYRREALLNRPKTVQKCRDEAVTSLSHVASQLEALNLSAATPDGFDSLVRDGFSAMATLVEFFMAAGASHEMNCVPLAIFLPHFRDKLDREILRLREDAIARSVLDEIEAGAKKRAARWKGKRTRGLMVSAPRNMLVFRLLERIEFWKEAWEALVESGVVVPKGHKRKFKASLHEVLRKIINLPPLSPETALKYHRVGWAMLKDATDPRGKVGFSLHPAFQSGGEFYGVVEGKKSFNAALNEAWRSVANIAGTKKFPKSSSTQE